MASITGNSGEGQDKSLEETQSAEIARCERMFDNELRALINEFRYESFATYGQLIGVMQQTIIDLHMESRAGDNDRDTFDSD